MISRNHKHLMKALCAYVLKDYPDMNPDFQNAMQDRLASMYDNKVLEGDTLEFFEM